MSKVDMQQGGGLNICEMTHSPVPWSDALIIFAVLAVVAAAAGWLQESKLSALRTVGAALLGVLVLAALATSWAVYRYRLVVDDSCLNIVDDRITGALVFVFNVGLIIATRLARGAVRRVRTERS